MNKNIISDNLQKKIIISSDIKDRIIYLLDGKDALTGFCIQSDPQIDHKVPLTRLHGVVNADAMSDEKLIEEFQLLSKEHKKIKYKACLVCLHIGRRPPFPGLKYWYRGNVFYNGTCTGCVWYDCNEWKKQLNYLINFKGTDNYEQD